jgi:hypothetical protein
MFGMRLYFRKPRSSFKGVTAVDATADDLDIGGYDLTFKCVSGNLWINWTDTAVADATAYLMAVGEVLELAGVNTLSVISDVTGATYEYITWSE